MSEPQSSRRSSSTTTKPPIKKANQPFLVHQKYKQQLARDAAASPRPASSPPGPRGRDGFLANAARWTVLALLTSAFLSRAVTETWMWNYDPDTSISLVRFPLSELALSGSSKLADGHIATFVCETAETFAVPDGAFDHFDRSSARSVRRDEFDRTDLPRDRRRRVRRVGRARQLRPGRGLPRFCWQRRRER